jgi:single-stranded-DNA-specific exonuclease
LVFSVAPIINSAGRLADAYDALALLMAATPEEAKECTKRLIEKNEIRREIQKEITDQAYQLLDNEPQETLCANVVFNPRWNKGVVGIVASRCVERYHKPAIVLTQSDDIIVGSARSTQTFDIYTPLAECSDLLLQYGGHQYAAGLAMKPQNLAAFKSKFEEQVRARITVEQSTPTLRVDMQIELAEINAKMLHILHQMSHFGPLNMRPVFMTKGVRVGKIRLIKDRHSKFWVSSQEANFQAIVFNNAELSHSLDAQKKYDIAYLIVENEYLNNKTIQLEVRAITPTIN